MLKTFLVLFLGISTLCSCNTNNRVEQVLALADQNRSELERVLLHYKDSPLKYKAACFLIENMPRYHTYEGWQIDTLKQISLRGRASDEVVKQWSAFRFHSLPKVYDIQVATADLLIENIDLAFDMWEKRPWAKYYTFDDFCEYILPYRILDEPLEHWRAAYAERYAPVLDSLYQGTDVVEAAKAVVGFLKAEGFDNRSDFTLPHLGGLFLFDNRVGYCRENCDIVLYTLRSVGIPVATDCYVVSPSYSSRHFWSAVIDTTGQAVSFNYIEKEMNRGEHDGRKKGKIYRQYYGRQPEKYKGIYEDEQVSPLFRDAFLKDVTHEYFPANSIEIAVENAGDEAYAYLSVFSERTFRPIEIAKVKGSKAVFQNMENGIVYQPVYADGSTAFPAGYPFLLQDNVPIYFRPDTTQLAEAVLTRKYPIRDNPMFLGTAVGVKIEGANRRDGKDACLLYQVADTPAINYNRVEPYSKLPYRYIRYTAPEKKRIQLAEIAFFADAASTRQIHPVEIFGARPLSEVHQSILKLAVDEDWVSFYMSAVDGETIVFDLGKPQPVERLVYIPRNDDNFIHPGDAYELYYQNGTQGWKSLGKQKAEDTRLTYRNVPQNAWLWLRNHTRGREERPFYYEDGKQVFP